MSDWLGPIGPWFYVIGFLVLGMVAFKIGTKIVTNAKKVDDWIGYGFGVIGLVFYALAGVWLEQTFLYGVIGWAQQFEVVVLAVFAFAFWKLVYTPFAASPDHHVPAATISMSLAIAWLLIPSIVAQGYIPGSAGELSADGIKAFSGLVRPHTAWFGEVPK